MAGPDASDRRGGGGRKLLVNVVGAEVALGAAMSVALLGNAAAGLDTPAIAADDAVLVG
jgi:hypothetical protein